MELRVGIQKFQESEIINKNKDVNLTCPICMDILHVPKQCETCKQYFCHECVQSQIKNSNKCPFRCSNGQKWKTKEIKYRGRLSKNKQPILYALSQIQVQCKEPYCKKKFKLLKYKEHYEKDCNQVFTFCEYLGCAYITRKINIQQHQETCLMKQTSFKYCKLKPLDDPSQCDSILTKISKYNEEKQYDKALQEYQEFGLRMQKTHGKYFPTLPTLLYQIGVIYFNLNEFEKALNNLLKFEEYVESKIEAKNNNEIQEHYSDVLFTIGYLYEELSQYSKAARYYERSLKQDISMNLNEDMSVLINLGHSYRLIGDYKKSRDYCLWAIKLYNEQKIQNNQDEENKENQEDLWKVYHNLTYSQYKYGDLDDARETYKKLSDISKKIHGFNSNQYWETQILNSQILQERGEGEEALDIIKKTIKKRKKILEKGHNDIIYTQRKYIQFLTKQAKSQANIAEKKIKDFIVDYVNYQNDQKEKWKYLLLQYEKSKVFLSQGKYKEALDIAEQYCIELLENKQVQCMHFRIFQCLGLIYQKNGKYIEAQEHFFRANSLIIEQFGENSYKHIKILRYMAEFYIDRENYLLAKQYIEKGIKIQNQLGIEKIITIQQFKYILSKTSNDIEKQQQLKQILKAIEKCQYKNKAVNDQQNLIQNDLLVLSNKINQKDKKQGKVNKKINRKQMERK